MQYLSMDTKRRKVRPSVAVGESQNERMIATLASSEYFRAFTRAFENLTGFAIKLLPVEGPSFVRSSGKTFPLKIGGRVAGILEMEAVRDGRGRKRMLDQKQLRAAESLIKIFSGQLGETSNQILIQSQGREP